MVKQKKQFFIVFLVLLIILVIYVILINHNKTVEKQEELQKEAETISIMNINVEDIVSFSYNYDETTYSYTKTNETWIYDDDTSLDLNEATIDDMLTTATNLTTQQSISDYDSLDAYGFLEPEKIITFETKTETYTLKIGAYNEIVGWYYLVKEGDSILYLVDSEILSAFDVIPQDFAVEETEEDTE